MVVETFAELPQLDGFGVVGVQAWMQVTRDGHVRVGVAASAALVMLNGVKLGLFVDSQVWPGSSILATEKWNIPAGWHLLQVLVSPAASF